MRNTTSGAQKIQAMNFSAIASQAGRKAFSCLA